MSAWAIRVETASARLFTPETSGALALDRPFVAQA